VQYDQYYIVYCGKSVLENITPVNGHSNIEIFRA